MLKYISLGDEVMREKISVIGVKATIENELLLQINSEISISSLKPLGQMLVDSDGLSFVYLLEKNNEYTYMIIKEEIWPKLKWAMEEKATVLLANDKEQIELVNFLDELSYLVENIKGNSNYGEDMVTKVEAGF